MRPVRPRQYAYPRASRDPKDARERLRGLLDRALKGDKEAALVLIDALAYTDHPELSERLATTIEKEPRLTWHALSIVREQIFADEVRAEREQSRREYDARERRSALTELDLISRAWRTASRLEQSENISATVGFIRNSPTILAQRARWLFDGSMGHGPQLLAREIAAASPRQNREAQLFRLILAFDDRIPFSAAKRVWFQLPIKDRQRVTRIMRDAIRFETAIK